MRHSKHRLCGLLTAAALALLLFGYYCVGSCFDPHRSPKEELLQSSISREKNRNLLQPGEWKTILEVAVKKGDLSDLLHLTSSYNQNITAKEWEEAIKKNLVKVTDENGMTHYAHSGSLYLLRAIKRSGYKPTDEEWTEIVNCLITWGKLEGALEAANLRGKPLSDVDWDRFTERSFSFESSSLEKILFSRGKKLTHPQWVKLLNSASYYGSKLDTERVVAEAKKNQCALWEEDFKQLLKGRVDRGDVVGAWQAKEWLSKFVTLTAAETERLRDNCIKKGDLYSCDRFEELFKIRLTADQWRTAYDGYIHEALIKQGKDLDPVVYTALAKDIQPTKKQLKQLLDAAGNQWRYPRRAYQVSIWAGRNGKLSDAFWESYLKKDYIGEHEAVEALDTATASGYKVTRAQLAHLVSTVWTNDEPRLDLILEAAGKNGQTLTGLEWAQILEKELRQVSIHRTTLLIGRSGIVPKKEQWTDARARAVAAGDYERAIDIAKLQEYFSSNDYKVNTKR